MNTENGSKRISVFQQLDRYQPSKTILVWACGMTAIATMAVGFGWGGWVTGGSAEKAATAAGETANRQLASAICVERFSNEPNSAMRLVEFRAVPDTYKKRQFIEAGGWATMPGQDSADNGVVEGCSTALAA